MLDHAAGSGQHTFKERAQDCYETPPEAVCALLKVEKLPKVVWEPACGPGSIVRTLRSAGHTVLATDLHDYEDSWIPAWGYKSGVNFLTCKVSTTIPPAIVTNPPYQLAQGFIEKAIELKVPLVIMLLRLAFLESKRRTEILERHGLARIHVFKRRLPMMHRRGWTGKKASSAMAFAWFCWVRGHIGPTTIDRIDW
ncbi:MAG TPA: hypothetical protein VF077_10985 [Nitrospiraceae bacterium]